MKYFILLVFFFTAGSSLFAQYTLRGRVVTAGPQQPLHAASVYLSNTSTGTATGSDGNFTLSIQAGNYLLVVSCIGYQTVTMPLNTASLPANLIISLATKSREMEEVVIEAYEENGWKKWGNVFLSNFLGKVPNAAACTLQNSDAVRFRFNKEKKLLRAFAAEPLVIVNKALGYTIVYDMEQFEYSTSTNRCLYTGYPRFTTLNGDSTSMAQWQQNRQDAYKGSLMHFMRSLYQNRLMQDGFAVRRVEGIVVENRYRVGKNLLTGDSIATATGPATVKLSFPLQVQVLYTDAQKGKKVYACRMLLYDPHEGIQVYCNGGYEHPGNLLVMEQWALVQKVANMLPLDYDNPEETTHGYPLR